MAQIDSLEIQITADAQKAVSSLKNLSQSLQNISTSLSRVNGSGFSGLTSGINSLTQAMQSYVSSGVKTADFTRLATQLGKLASTDYSGLYNLSGSITQLSGATSTLATVSARTSAITEFAKALSKLGGANIGRAVTNIPQLANAMRGLLTTLSQSPNVSRSVVALTRNLADLTRNLSGVRSVSNSSARGLNTFTSSAQKSTSASKGLASAIGKIYATYWLLFRALSVFGKAVNYASSLTEVQNVVEQTFGQATKVVNQFAKDSKNDLGMSELTAKQIASRYQAMGGAMDIQSRQVKAVHEGLKNLKDDYKGASNSASGMSLTLTRLAGDMASFYDQDQLDVAKDLEAVYTGMTRPLRKYGIDLTQATLQEYANAKGMDVKVSKMTQAEKTMLRYQYVLEHTTKAQDDFQRTADSWANQVKLMKQNFISLGTTIGQVFINAFKPMIKQLNNILVAVNEFATKVANAIGHIFGWTYEGNEVGLLAGADEDAEELGDSLGSADKKAKKLKATLMGYDELNVMQEKKDDDSGSGSGGGSGSGSGEGDESKTGHWVKAFKSNIEDLFGLGRTIADTLQEMMENIDWDSVYKKARNFGKGLAEFLNGLFKPEMFYQLGRTIAGCLNTALHFLDSFAEEFDFDQLGLSIAEGINGFFDEFDFVLLASTINRWVHGIFNTLKTAIQNIEWNDVWNGIKDFIKEIDTDTIALIVGAWLTPKVLTALKNSVVNAIVGAFGGSAITTAGAILLTIEIALVVKNLIADIDNYKEAMGTDSLWDALLNGDKEKKRKYAENKKYNPYREFDIKQKSKVRESTNLFDAKSYARLYVPQEEDFKSFADYKKAYEEFVKTYENKFGTGWFANISRSIGELQASQVTLNDVLNKSGDNYFDKYVRGAKDSSASVKTLNDDIGNLSDSSEKIKSPFKKWQEENQKTREAEKTQFNDWYDDFVSKTSDSFDKAKESFANWQQSNKEKRDEEKQKFNEFYEDITKKLKERFDEMGKRVKDWWDDEVTPWFTKEKWQEQWNNVKTAFNTKWNEITTWWKQSGLYKWFNEHVKPWFTVEKWQTEWNNVKTAFSNKWEEIVNWWKTSGLYKWYEEHVKPYFTTEKWSFSGIKDGLEQAFNNAIAGIKSIWNEFANWMNDKLNFSWDGFTIGDKSYLGGHINLGKLPTFATGGFPEDGLFMANHSELVGKFSNGRTAVANNQQITEGIRQAVLDGMMQVVMATSDNNNSDNRPIQLLLDGRVIAETTYNNFKTMGRQGVIPRFI